MQSCTSREVFRQDIHAELQAEIDSAAQAEGGIVNFLPGAEDNVRYLVAEFIRAQTSYSRHVAKVSYLKIPHSLTNQN
jgi:hypothetical protein